jgi:diguanylate cyclase (GGDEF)-like protein/PAS domain S-box-containing protein
MPESGAALETRQSALKALLSEHGPAVVAAMADRGFRIPLPESFPLGVHEALAVPTDEQTMLHLVVPADRMAIVAAWERARTNGIGVVAVHALSDPETRLMLSMIDAHEDYGVWIGVLTRGEESETPSEALVGPLVVPSRPRQATMHKSMTAVITEVDAKVTAMLGWTPEQMIGSRSTEFIHPDDHDRAVQTWMQLLTNLGSQRVRVRHRLAGGGFLWVETEHIHNGAEDPDQVDVIAHISDISDEMAAHEALHRREQLFSRLAEALPTGVVQLGQDGTVVYANARLGAILQTDRPSTASELLANVVLSDREAVEQAFEAALQSGADSELEIEVRPARARASRRCAVTVAAVADQEGKPAALVCVTDVTDSAQLREELRAQATHDALTGCLNRLAVMQALEQILADRDGDGLAVIFIDIDNFKPINDSLGHATGDQLLTAVAGRLNRQSREGDLVARLGGDEFLLVCPGAELPAQAVTIAARIRDALNHPVALPAGVIELRASIGVAWSQTETTADTLIGQADSAMYQSKRDRNGEPVLFADSPVMAASSG